MQFLWNHEVALDDALDQELVRDELLVLRCKSVEVNEAKEYLHFKGVAANSEFKSQSLKLHVFQLWLVVRLLLFNLNESDKFLETQKMQGLVGNPVRRWLSSLATDAVVDYVVDNLLEARTLVLNEPKEVL